MKGACITSAPQMRTWCLVPMCILRQVCFVTLKLSSADVPMPGGRTQQEMNSAPVPGAELRIRGRVEWDDGARSCGGTAHIRRSCLGIGAVLKFSSSGSGLRAGLSLPAVDKAPGCGPVSADVPSSGVAPRGQRLRWHRSTEQAASKLGLLSPVTLFWDLRIPGA